jgi:hypothetical protein
VCIQQRWYAWKREWIGGKEICCLGAANNHVMATWSMGVIARVVEHVTRRSIKRNARTEHTFGGLSPTTIIPCLFPHCPFMLSVPHLPPPGPPNVRTYTFSFHARHIHLALPKLSDPAPLTALITIHLLLYASITCQSLSLPWPSLNVNVLRETCTKRNNALLKSSQKDPKSPL